MQSVIAGVFVFPGTQPYPQLPAPTSICVSRLQPQICISQPQSFVLQLKFVIVTVFTYINHSNKKRKGFSFLTTMYKLSVCLYVLTC